MKYRLVLVVCFLLTAFLLGAPATSGAQESITKTANATMPTSYAFGADDNFTDSIVRITTLSDCELKVTRIPVTPGDILKRCGGSYHPSVMVMENDQVPTNAKSAQHPSVYRIEPVGVCPAAAFPVSIEISYFGKFEKTGPNPNNKKVFRLRMIHEPSNGDECRDISTGAEQLQGDTDPKGSGGEGGGFSDFFLLNVIDNHIKNDGYIKSEFDHLIDLAGKLFSAHQQKVIDAKAAFAKAVGNPAQKDFQDAIDLLKQFKTEVDKARGLGSLLPGKAKRMQAEAPQLEYKVQQYAATEGIDLPLP